MLRTSSLPAIALAPFGKRFLFTLALLLAIAVLFWTQSRYPSLDDKAIMSGAIQLEDPMSFEAVLPVRPDYPLWKKIAYTTINWIDTNRQGMTFGLLFGAAFLTLLRYLRRANFRGAFANSAFGLAIGAPLGVCVNCAAPIAKGLYSGGARAETTLAAMLSSPTFNIVVLTMLFSLLPFYMAVAKIAASLVVILVAVPLICRLLPDNQRQLAGSERANCPVELSRPAGRRESIGEALIGVGRDYLTDLWFIVRTTVPLMLLAGLLGAIVATLMPPDLLTDVSVGLVSLTLVAIVGTFVPVPIAFDVVIASAFLNSGMRVGFVMALLFTLGLFSIYSFMIVARSISWRAAGLIGAVAVVLGVVVGAGADYYHKWQFQRALDILSGLSDIMMPSARAADTDPVRVIRDGSHEIALYRRPFADRSPEAATPFRRVEARRIGITKPVEFSFKDMWPPFWEGRSIASGDIDNDGDPDLVLASTERGLYVYLNDGTGQFSEVDYPIDRVRSMPVFNAVPVDLDNDGWLDLFLTTYREGNHVLWNKNGRFSDNAMTPVRNRDKAILTLAVAFGDIDRDGTLDAVLGNWAAGWYRRIPGEESRNRIVFNDGGRLSGDQFADLPGMPGETLSMLISDVTGNDRLDLVVGNDFEQPDIFYFSDDKGRLRQVRRKDGIIPFTTTTTMAIKSADLDNDGTVELYIGQIAGRSSGVSQKLKMQAIALYCRAIEDDGDRRICQKNMDIKTWYKSGNQFDPTFAHKCLELTGIYQAECKAMLVKDLAIQARDPSICKLIAADQVQARHYCDIHFWPSIQPSRAEVDSNIVQIKGRNVLLKRQPDGTYRELAEQLGLDIGGWTWDVKIADFDNDAWQDVYVVNGTWVPNEVTPSNLYFRNRDGSGFDERSGPYGLEDYLITPAATAADFDNDGDLDLIAVTVNGPVVAFINATQNGNAIGFQIRDHVANRFGIGNKIEIRYGKDGARRQVRELQTGGGFQSFDAPVVHFGLGDHDGVESVAISWSDGGKTTINGPIDAGATYLIKRNRK